MRVLLLSAILTLAALLPQAGAATNPLPATQPAYHAVPHKAAQLFDETMVWTVHLKFTPQQWAAIELKRNEQFNQMRRGGGGRGGPDPMGGIAGMLAPNFVKAGDTDHDGKLSKDEFNSLAQTWFTSWDSNKTGKLNAEQLRLGLTTVMGMPAFRLQGAQGQRNGLAASQGIQFEYVHADLEFEGQTLKNVGVRYKGNGTWMNSQGTSKHSTKIDFNHFTHAQGLAGLGKLNLHNNIIDPGFMNEPLSHKLYRDAGVPAPRTAYARVYVTVDGRREHEYFGLYSIVEDVDRDFEQDVLKAKDGAIFKPVTPNLFGDMGDDWAKYKQTYDPKTDVFKAQTQRVIDFARLLSHAEDKEFAAKLPEYLDLDEFSRYMAVTVWLSTLDSILAMGQNFYIYLDPKTNKFQFLPWDLDHSFGHFALGGGEDEREELSIRHPWKGENRFLERVFKVEAFQKLYLAKFKEFNKTIFVPQRFIKQIDHFADAIRPAVKAESYNLLENFDSIISGEGMLNGRDSEGKPIRAFVPVRAASVSAQLAATSDGIILRNSGRNPFGGPASTLAATFLIALDTDQDGELSRAEVAQGFAKWYSAWATEKVGTLSEEQLKTGLYRDLFRYRGGARRVRD